jgi:hypothetical protein
MARIAAGGFMHESNSFVPGQTGFAKYAFETSDRPPLCRGDEIGVRLSSLGAAFGGTP